MSIVNIPILERCSRMYKAIIDDMNGVSPNKRPRSEYRKKTREELWHGVRDQLYPEWIYMTEKEKEIVESSFEMNYFVALGANKSIPSTVTSSSEGNDSVGSGPLVIPGTTGYNYQTLYTSPVLYQPRRVYKFSPMYRTPTLVNTNDLGSNINSSSYAGYPGTMTLSRSYDYTTPTAGRDESSGSGSLLQMPNYGWPGFTQAGNGINTGNLNGYSYNIPSTSAGSSGFNEVGYGGYYNTPRGSVISSSSNGVNNYNPYTSDLQLGINGTNRRDMSGPLDLRPSRKRALDYCQLDPLPPFSTLQRDIRTPQPSSSYYSPYATPSISRSPLTITMNGDANNNVGDDIDPFQLAIEQSLKY